MITATTKERKYEIEFDNKNSNSGTVNGKNFNIDIIKTEEKEFHVIRNNKNYHIVINKISPENKEIILTINNEEYTFKINNSLDLLLEKLGISSDKDNKTKELKAPMPGMVTDIKVKEGDLVKEGDTLIVLEAMKMENNIKAVSDTVIKEICCTTGNAVEKNEILINFAD